jgi:DNA-binding ferritin-like protein
LPLPIIAKNLPSRLNTTLASRLASLAVVIWQTRWLRSAHVISEEHNDVATASLIETLIDEAERRPWFLAEAVSPR